RAAERRGKHVACGRRLVFDSDAALDDRSRSITPAVPLIKSESTRFGAHRDLCLTHGVRWTRSSQNRSCLPHGEQFLMETLRDGQSLCSKVVSQRLAESRRSAKPDAGVAPFRHGGADAFARQQAIA